MSTHDIFRAKQIADRLGIMTEGNLATVLDRAEIEQADLELLYFQYMEAYEAREAGETAAETEDSGKASAEAQ